MKHLTKKLLFCFLFVMGCTTSFGQNAEAIYQQREILNSKITTYLEKNSDYVMSSTEEERFKLSLISDDEHAGSIDVEKLKVKFTQALLLEKFKEENPNFNNSYPKSTGFSYPDPCYRGDFESWPPLITYEGYWYNETNSSQCDQIPLDVTSSPDYTSIPMTGTDPRFLLTNNIPDPNVPGSALYQTNGGSNHALRINPNDGGGEDISVLRKNFSTATTGDQIVSFSSAIVLQFPHNNVIDPFMTARILDATGLVVGGPICITPSTPGIVWTPFSILGKPNVWMDWKCFQLPYYGTMGDNYVLEVSFGDCGANAHGGYAYIDDICNTVCSPINLDCCDALAGQILSWSAVPGAMNYEVDVYYNDTACCPGTTEAPLGMSYVVTDNIFMVPTTYSDCFSWKVRAVYPDGSRTDYSEVMCDCDYDDPANPCETPINLGCEHIDNHRLLSWDPVAGALGGYIVEITYNDPMCPGCTGSTSIVTVNTTDNWLEVIDVSTCFSWKVRSVCNTASLSDWSETICACPYSAMSPQGNLHGNHDIKDLELLVVPNPADEFVSITLKSTEAEFTSSSKFIVFDAAGAQVLESEIMLNTEKRLNVSSLSSGVYIYNVFHDEALMASGKLIIE